MPWTPKSVFLRNGTVEDRVGLIWAVPPSLQSAGSDTGCGSIRRLPCARSSTTHVYAADAVRIIRETKGYDRPKDAGFSKIQAECVSSRVKPLVFACDVGQIVYETTHGPWDRLTLKNDRPWHTSLSYPISSHNFGFSLEPRGHTKSADCLERGCIRGRDRDNVRHDGVAHATQPWQPASRTKNCA